MAGSLSEHIRDGNFPDSNEILGQETTSDGIASLLTSIVKSKAELEDEIRDVGQNIAGDVDEWILQATKLQNDIAKCKIEARQIVEEHERGQSLRSIVKDADNQVQLLEAEIAFTRTLEHEMMNILEMTQVLHQVESDLSRQNPVSATRNLVLLQPSIKNIQARQTRSLLSQIDEQLRNESQKQLVSILSSRWAATRTTTISTLSVSSDLYNQKSSASDTPNVSSDDAISALQELQAFPSAVTSILTTVQSFVFSIISPSSPCATEVNTEDDKLTVTRDGTTKNAFKILAILQAAFQFLHHKIPEKVQSSVVNEFLPKVISGLTSEWLDPALPHDLHELQQLDPLRQEVSNLVTTLNQYSWPGGEMLTDWIEQIPRGWLTKRRVASLDAVRKAFNLAQGSLRPVERVERQTVSIQEPEAKNDDEADNWDTNWDDEPQATPSTSSAEANDQDASGWDFDTEDTDADSGKKASTTKNHDEDDVGDAWGWGDDDDDNTKPELENKASTSHPTKKQPNGEAKPVSKEQEMVLTETYHITDIPDYILEIIGKDLADAEELQNSASKYFDTTSPATGLAGLPNLILALFRATAPTYYTLPSAKYTLTNINLYNDTLYLVQKLTSHPSSTALNPSIQSLQKFARQTYTSELDIQRTILTDLLDGAQGFDRSTTYPYSQACNDAVSSTIDRVRQLHTSWSGILGESHLLQSLGTLLTMIFGKIIKDVEDMDDISEAESTQLVKYCQQILSLEDLFASQLPDLTAQAGPAPSSQIVLYVPNYLRFQYLQQLLESSLVDIKYLWTEGELSLEFSVDEVVDLIRALFAESQHRRNAIRDIKAKDGR